MQQTRAELVNAPNFHCEPEQLKKYQELFAKNYASFMLINKYLSFGDKPGQINVKFVWTDSFSGARVESRAALLEAISSKFNYAVCLSRRACYMNLEDDGIKYACKYMQQAAWIFDDLKKNVSQLNPSDVTCDFTCETLECLSTLMLAQAQYLFYKMATEKKQSPELLSKVALQISEYFKLSHERGAMNLGVTKF